MGMGMGMSRKDERVVRWISASAAHAFISQPPMHAHTLASQHSTQKNKQHEDPAPFLITYHRVWCL